MSTQDDFDIVDRPNGNPPSTQTGLTETGQTAQQPDGGRRGKTHGNAQILEMLRALSRGAAIEQNMLINARNRKREKKRAYSNLAEAVSSNESLITLPDEDRAPSPPPQSVTHQASAYLSALSPNSAKKWLKDISRKRRRDTSDNDSSEEDPVTQKSRPDEESAKQKSKRFLSNPAKEVATVPGHSLPPGYNLHHHVLLTSHVYMPLSLFTNVNLRNISREGPTLATTKISISGTRGKENMAKILDVAKFEAQFGREEDLSLPEWSEAARNFIRFYDEIVSDGPFRPSARWDSHFGYFHQREDFVRNFQSILMLDIRMRKDYLAQPFEFSGQHYAFELGEMIRDVKDQNLENRLIGSWGSSRTNATYAQAPSYAQTPSYAQAPSHSLVRKPKFGMPFQKSAPSDPSAVLFQDLIRGRLPTLCQDQRQRYHID
ncbi:hypothetical protein JOM56_013614 [Amanita muscaria]